MSRYRLLRYKRDDPTCTHAHAEKTEGRHSWSQFSATVLLFVQYWSFLDQTMAQHCVTVSVFGYNRLTQMLKFFLYKLD